MKDTYSVKLDGVEVGRLRGEGIVPAHRPKKNASLMDIELVPDPKLLSLKRDGKTVFVFYISNADNVTVEKLEEDCATS